MGQIQDLFQGALILGGIALVLVIAAHIALFVFRVGLPAHLVLHLAPTVLIMGWYGLPLSALLVLVAPVALVFWLMVRVLAA